MNHCHVINVTLCYTFKLIFAFGFWSHSEPFRLCLYFFLSLVIFCTQHYRPLLVLQLYNYKTFTTSIAVIFYSKELTSVG